MEKEKISREDADATLSRIRTATDLQVMKDVDFVVEAATEVEKIKLQIFGDLDRICPPDSVLATNHVVHTHRKDRGPGPVARTR